MTRIDDLRKTAEAAVGSISPAKAQDVAKSLLEPGAAKEQVAKLAGDILEWSQRNGERIRNIVRREMQEQLHQAGVATQSDLNALRKRVRELERAAGMTASGRTARAAKTTRTTKTAKTTARKKTAAQKPTAKPSGSQGSSRSTA
jgi:polyhydroxyalkanoate synthesis regulator phasin